MGERIRDLAQIRLKNMAVNIELNAGSAYHSDANYIHIQNDRLRLELSDREYLQIAVAVRVAADKIKSYKDLKDGI